MNLKPLSEKTQRQLSLFDTPVPAEPLLPATSYREKILSFESILAAQQQLQVDITHYLAPGVYAREMTLPAGAVITGKIHRHAHINVISKGSCTVASPEGVREIVAPCVFVSSPGTKRAIFAHEETRWMTIHPTEETDLMRIEEYVITKDDGEWAQLIEQARNAVVPQSELQIIEEVDL